MVLLTIFPYNRPLWSRQVLFGAPTLGLKALSAAICWTSLVPAANVLNNATQTMNSVPWQRVCTLATCRSSTQWTKRDFVLKCFCVSTVFHLSVCLSSVRLRTYFYPSVSATLAHQCILVWISMENIPDCNGSHLVMLTPCLPFRSTPWFPHRRHLEPIGNRVTPSHKALIGSQTH